MWTEVTSSNYRSSCNSLLTFSQKFEEGYWELSVWLYYLIISSQLQILSYHEFHLLIAVQVSLTFWPKVRQAIFQKLEFAADPISSKLRGSINHQLLPKPQDEIIKFTAAQNWGWNEGLLIIVATSARSHRKAPLDLQLRNGICTVYKLGVSFAKRLNFL